MDLLPNDEQADLTGAIHEFLAAEMPPASLREPVTDTRFDARWREIGDLGWFGLAVAEELGGVGYGVTEEALLFQELGRSVAPGPFLSTALACQMASRLGDDSVISSLVAGESRAGLAVAWDDQTAAEDGLRGRFLVIDGNRAGYLVVRTAGAVALIAAPPPTAFDRVPSIDETTDLAELRLDSVSPLVIATGAHADELVERGTILSAAMLAGMAEATRDISVQYAKDRRQFNQPIGTFQAVSRRCADMAVRAWSATSLVAMAALCLDSARRDHRYQAAAAKTVAGDAAIRNAADNIQNLGAIGFTAEHDAHYFFKRARLVDMVWGDSRRQADTLVDDSPGRIGLGDGRELGRFEQAIPRH